MRRLFCLLTAVLLLAAPPALANEAFAQASAVLFEALLSKNPGSLSGAVEFAEEGPWISAVSTLQGPDFTAFWAVCYSTETGAVLTWDELFEDGDAAALRLEALAEEAAYANAYAEYNQVSPMPRDNFAVRAGQLFVYYPPEQLSHVSGRAGAFGFYAYELAGLLPTESPLVTGNPEGAAQGLSDALSSGALPGHEAFALGTPMSDAADALSLVDVPNLTYDYAVYQFEAPEMRGVSLLSPTHEDNVNTASITGIYAERIDFYGLFPGVSMRADCEAALGAPDRVSAVTDADAYTRLPNGETLRFEDQGNALEFHFVDGVLHSVTLRSL